MMTYVCLSAGEVDLIQKVLKRSQIKGTKELVSKIEEGIGDKARCDMELIGADDYELYGDEDDLIDSP